MNFDEFKSSVYISFKNSLIKKGKKIKIDILFEKVLLNIKLKYKIDPVLVIFEALSKIKPEIGLISRKRGAFSQKLPKILKNESQKYSLAVRSLLININKRKEYDLYTRVFNELIETYEGRSSVIKQNKDMYKLASANRSLLRFKRKKKKIFR